MPSLDILDVAIGLIVVYLLLSLICSSINEGIETFLKNRSWQLERGIREILNDPDGRIVTHLFYNHPLINCLFQGTYDIQRLKKRRFFAGFSYRGSNLPSYIPSGNFALAMLDIVMPATATQLGGAAGAIKRGSKPEPPEFIASLRSAAANFPQPQLGKALVLLIDASANDVTRIREGIEGWFDSSMDRVSGWYKRRAQIMLFSIGLAVAALLNIDTVEIATHLVTDPAVRSSLVATAQEYAKADSPNTVIVPSSGQAAGQFARTASAVKQIEDLGLPIGWKQAPSGYGWFLKIAGILASALTAALGAPFWFDVLNRFVVIRSTVKPREKSVPEESKD
jgi:hypothetical protein